MNKEFKGKAIIVRVDLNLPLKQGKPQLDERALAHASTIKKLLREKARVVLLAHQGRQGGAYWLESLSWHAKLLSRLIKKQVSYVNDLYGGEAIKAIKTLKPGQVLLLKNVRSDPAETKELSPRAHANSKLVKTLAPLFDYFMLDALSVAHRCHASVVGFALRLPSMAGPVLVQELEGLKRTKAALKAANKPLFLLGGAKPAENLTLVKATPKVARILTGGLFAQLCLLAQGYRLGAQEDYLKKELNFISVKPLKQILKKFEVSTPTDLAVELKGKRGELTLKEFPNGLIYDIGKRTAERYKKEIAKADFLLLKGPFGKYEDDRFALGTKSILRAVASSKAFSFIAGGNTLDALKKFRISKRKFSFCCLSGGAALEWLAGKQLPGLKALGFKFA